VQYVAIVKPTREAALNSAPGRLGRVVRFGAALGLAGVDYADAIDEIESAIWSEGALPIDRPSQRRAWELTREHALRAYENAPDAFGLAEQRAHRNAPGILDTLPADARLEDLAAAIAASEPLLDKQRAMRLARGVATSLARPPVVQRGPAPGADPFAETRSIPGVAESNHQRRALRLLGIDAMGNLSGLRLATFNGEPVQPIALQAASNDADLGNAVLALEQRAYEAGNAALGAALRRERLGMTRPTRGNEPRPVDLWQRHEAPELPRGCLPSVIEQFAFEQGEMMGADPAGLAMSALAICAAAVPDTVELQVKQHDTTWRESARLWVGLVGMPSTKKTPIMSAAMRPLRAIDRDMASRNATEMRAWSAVPKKEQTSPPPPQPRLMVEDATIEALQEVLKDSPNGVISAQDELSGWFGAMDKYSPGKGAAADRAFWLRAYNGGAYNVNRIARGASFIPNLSIGLLGGIQPEPLRKLAGDSVDDGLIQRFLPVILRPATVGRDAVTGNAAVEYERLVERLTCMHGPRGPGNLAQPEPVRFSQDARAVREALEAEHVELVRALEIASPKLAAHFGKHDGIFARLCLLWHCVEAEGACPLPEIGGDIADRVARFMRDYLRPSAVAFYAGLLGMSAGHEELMALAAVIVSAGLEEVDARAVQRSTHALRHVTADEARRLCEKLEAFGWLDPTEPRMKSNSPRWRVVAAVHDLFAERGRMEADRRAKARAAFAEAFGQHRES